MRDAVFVCEKEHRRAQNVSYPELVYLRGGGATTIIVCELLAMRSKRAYTGMIILYK